MEEIFKYRTLLIELVKRDIKKKYRRSILGVLWSMLNPFFTMLIITMVFSSFFKFSIKNFPVYLLTGQLIFNFYSEATNTAMGSILENASLIKKVYVPKHIFPIARVLSSCVNFILSLPGLILIIVITKAPVKFSIVFSLIPVLYVLFFCFGVGLLLSSVAVYFRDMFHLYSVLLTALNYLTPLFYPKEIVPEKYMFLINMNPMVYFVDLFRDMVYYGKMPTLNEHLNCIFIIIISLFIGVVVFNMNKKKFILHI